MSLLIFQRLFKHKAFEADGFDVYAFHSPTMPERRSEWQRDQRRKQAGEREQAQDYTPLKDLKLSDHFLFGEVMCDPEICKTALGIILGRTVSRITYYNREQGMEVHPSYKGIRLDVCFADEGNTIYSVEIQNANRYHIPRRSRHYQSVMDVKIMPRGEVDYNRLSDGIIIFICTFDLFGCGSGGTLYDNIDMDERTESRCDSGRIG